MSCGSQNRFWFCLLLVNFILGVRGLQRQELFKFGIEAGDKELLPGGDSSAELHLNGTFFYFNAQHQKVHINTNGFVAVVKPPSEADYLGKMPSSFPMIAALLGDLDNSDGQGHVFYRLDSNVDVLRRASMHISQAFPTDEEAIPHSVLVVTWVNMAAQGDSGREDGLDFKRNTFQLVVAFMTSSACAIVLYPTDGLQFLSTSIGGKNTVLEAGFNEGVVSGWFKNSQGTYFQTTTDDEASVMALTHKTNSGRKGVWVFEVGPSRLFAAIIPGIVPLVEATTESRVTVPPAFNQTETDSLTYQTQTTVAPTEYPTTYQDSETITQGYATSETEEPSLFRTEHPEMDTVTPTYSMMEEIELDHTDPTYPYQTDFTDPILRPQYTSPEPNESQYSSGHTEYLDPSQPQYTTFEPTEAQYSSVQPEYPELVQTQYTTLEPREDQYSSVQPEYPDRDLTQPIYTTTQSTDPKLASVQPENNNSEFVQPGPTNPPPSEPEYPPVEPEYPKPDLVQPRYISPDSNEPKYHPVNPESPNTDSDLSRYINPETFQPVPGQSQPRQPQIVVVDEDEDLNVNVFAYSSEKCVDNKQKCSVFADCRDYSTGYCCHCRPGYYGNGKDCVPDGKPQRMNGKLNGRLYVGTTFVELSNHDLHSYVVVNDGRAYVAISNIPKSVGPSLQPLSSLGGIIGWAFALEQRGYKNGFSMIGAVFSRQAEVIFYPGNERLSIRQQFVGIDEHEHLVLNTEVEGHLPTIPLGSSVHISPYKEIYQYDRDLITSSSNRDYTITFPDGTVNTRSYQWRQTITFKSCPHSEDLKTTQQLSVDQIFVWFDDQNELIRYAMTNKMGSVHSGVEESNPCFTGHHGCDINAVCRAGEGLQFTCECATGFTGDGYYCYERVSPVDHCEKGSHNCDVSERAVCSYTGGSDFSCSCLPGFEGDGHVCRDVDECQRHPCHRDALCTNTPGSYSCLCGPGFEGDGVVCHPVPTEQEKTQCERERESAKSVKSESSGFFSFFRPRPVVNQFIPQCDQHGAFEPTQCHTSIGQCWCVDANGQEVPDTRTGSDSPPLCINQAVTPTPVGPSPRPDIHPVTPGTHLLFAQSGRIHHIPLDGYSMKKDEAKVLLHVPDRVVIALAYDCVEKMVYWTDITGPAISKASIDGGDVIPVVTKELQSPEGLAIDYMSRLLFWTDSMRDTIEVSRLDGSDRRVLFDSDLVNPRPIVTDPIYGRLYWADWDRDGPKIEMSNMDGTDRAVLVKDDLGLPNGLTFDIDSQQLCWADAGTRVVECVDPHRHQRKRIVDAIQYPFAVVSFGRKLYYTDWRREAVVAVDRHTQSETEEFQPQKRSRLYGITTTIPTCPQAYNYCLNNGGCSHLCLPRVGGFSCRCPDAAVADGQCVEDV